MNVPKGRKVYLSGKRYLPGAELPADYTLKEAKKPAAKIEPVKKGNEVK